MGAFVFSKRLAGVQGGGGKGVYVEEKKQGRCTGAGEREDGSQNSGGGIGNTSAQLGNLVRCGQK